MNTTYTIASETGNIAITQVNAYEDGSFVESKSVAMRDGSFVCYTRNNRRTNWRKFSWGAMAKKRFAWDQKAANEYFSN